MPTVLPVRALKHSVLHWKTFEHLLLYSQAWVWPQQQKAPSSQPLGVFGSCRIAQTAFGGDLYFLLVSAEACGGQFERLQQ